MAEKRSLRFRAVLMLAERQEQEAATRLGDYREELHAEQQQLEMLREYSATYMAEIESRRTGLKSSDLLSYRNFLQRLGQAEQDQVHKVTRMLDALERIQLEWQKKYHYRQSIEDLIERFKHQESEALDKQLQRELDELASQSYQRNNK